jgi:hypothetical protein
MRASAVRGDTDAHGRARTGRGPTRTGADEKRESGGAVDAGAAEGTALQENTVDRCVLTVRR